MQFPFAKYQGAGNDFIVIDDRKEQFPTSQANRIASLCHRRLGIGADGLLLLQSSQHADFRMRIFNSDGSEPTMCGNGVRCLVDFARRIGIKQEQLTCETNHGIISYHQKGEKIAVDLGVPRLIYQNLSLNPSNASIHVVHTGVPHAIVFVSNAKEIDLENLGRQIRFHPLFAPEGVNVNFASVSSEGAIFMRTYERGVEAETEACGTGAAAVGWMAAQLFSFSDTIPIQTSTSSLEIRLRGSSVEVIGMATYVFEGQITI